MTRYDNLLPPIQALLSSDATLAGMVDFFELGTPGPTLQDAKLEGTHQTSLWLKRPSKNKTPYIGSGGEFRLIIQVDVLTKISAAQAYDIGDLVEDLLESTSSISYGGVTYPLGLWHHGRGETMWDNRIGCWDEMIRFRVEGSYG